MKQILISFLLCSNIVSAYVKSKTDTGSDIKWKSNNTNLDIYLNPTPIGHNTLNITSVEVIDIVNQSINNWNAVSPYCLELKIEDQFRIEDTKRSISFSSNPAYFGSGVLAVTSVSYNQDNGLISNANILINSSIKESSFQDSVYQFTANKSLSSGNLSYLGDIVTHEIGHLWGLSHSEHIGSSMVYAKFKGQHTIHSDDIAGIKDIYNVQTTSSQVSGRVLIGGYIPTFGAQVTAISVSTGESVQSVLTDESGTFDFYNLDTNENYIFMVSPLKNLESISSGNISGEKFYSSIRSNFCSQQNHRPGFYTKCGSSNDSRPQVFKLNSNELLNVGDLTINCDEKINREYFSNKFDEVRDSSFELLSERNKTSAIFYGYFDKDEIDKELTGNGDRFTIDLTNFDTNNLNINDLVLRVMISTEAIGSDIETEALIKRKDESTFRKYNSSYDNLGKKNTTLTFDLDLSQISSQNFFELKLFPRPLTQNDKLDIFSTIDKLSNKNSLYLLNVQVGRYTNSVFESLNDISSYPYDDNYMCLEGEASYTISPSRSINSTSNLLAGDEQVVSCATVAYNGGGNGGGPKSFLLGIMGVLMLVGIQNLKLTFKL